MNNPPKPAKIPLSQQALDSKKAELVRLMKLKKEILDRLVVAREMGDLSENGAYKAAKFELGGVRRQLRQLHYLLANAYVPKIDQSDLASFGKEVTLQNETHTLVFTLVGSYEADPEQMKFSLDSPIGQAVVGKKVGAEVLVSSPTGEVKYLLARLK
ncbi:MAG: GreA/GreB family elongation factor [Patescibacteria group bacterium]